MVERLATVAKSELRRSSLLPSTRYERIAVTSKEAKAVAAHELNHWMVGNWFGYLGDISMTPQGYSRARTKYYGYIPPDVLSIMFAAGAVNTPHSTAFGYGMDMFMVDRFSERGGLSRMDSILSAQAILKSYPDKLLERAAEIIAFLGNSGNEISSETMYFVLERARQELIEENVERERLVDINSFSPENYVRPETRDFTYIEDDREFIRVVYVKNEKEEEKLFICRICGRYDNEHDEEIHRQKEEEELKMRDKNSYRVQTAERGSPTSGRQDIRGTIKLPPPALLRENYSPKKPFHPQDIIH